MTAALLGLLLGFIGSMPVAGPIALLVVRKGVREEYDEGAALALGASVPEAIYCGMALVGFDFLFMNYPAVESASKVLGGLLMVVMGSTFILMRPKAQDAEALVPRKNRKAAPFMTGFTVSALNPTLILTWSGVSAVLYASLGVFSDLEKIVFPVAVGAGNFLWFAVMLSMMQRHRGRFGQQGITRAMKGIGAAILLFGVWILVKSVLEASSIR
jgi:threonine/homoserine/homoserine lactone efflux protein